MLGGGQNEGGGWGKMWEETSPMMHNICQPEKLGTYVSGALPEEKHQQQCPSGFLLQRFLRHDGASFLSTSAMAARQMRWNLHLLMNTLGLCPVTTRF